MADKKFDLGEYVEVKDRIKLLYDLYANGRLVTEAVEILTDPAGKQRVMVRAAAYRTPDDPHPGIGHSWLELPGTTPYTKGSEVENAETSAWGRAIAALGILVDRSIASAQEVANKETSPEATVYSSTNPPPPAEGPVTDGGLIGVAEVGKPPSDFELRTGPDGTSAVSFRLVQGRQSIKVVARGPLADALAVVRTEVIGKRVTCWGSVSQESFRPAGATKDVNYRVLSLERIATPDYMLPATVGGAAGPSQTEAAGDVMSPSPAAPNAAEWDAEIAALPLVVATKPYKQADYEREFLTPVEPTA